MRQLQTGPKRAVNLTLSAATLDLAKEMGLNISQTVDCLLAEEVLRLDLQRWNEDNREAIEAYNARIANDGSFSQRIRKHLAESSDLEGAAR